MKSTNEIIAKLRKDAGLTQEQLANLLCVSSQTISKWETGTTMPDIMLLPVIADVFNVDIDHLFGRCAKKTKCEISKENIHEALYDSFFEQLCEFWNSFEPEGSVKSKACEMREYIKNHSDTQTLILSNPEGNGIYADCDIALAFCKNKNNIKTLLEDETPWIVLKRLADGETRKVYGYLVNNRGKSFTSSFIASKCGIKPSDAERALINLLHLKLICRRELNTDDGVIYIYSEWATYKTVLVYSLLSLASRLGNYTEIYKGFMS